MISMVTWAGGGGGVKVLLAGSVQVRRSARLLAGRPRPGKGVAAGRLGAAVGCACIWSGAGSLTMEEWMKYNFTDGVRRALAAARDHANRLGMTSSARSTCCSA